MQVNGVNGVLIFRSELYGAFYEKIKPTENNKGKVVQVTSETYFVLQVFGRKVQHINQNRFYLHG